jgi:hypothetical protein
MDKQGDNNRRRIPQSWENPVSETNSGTRMSYFRGLCNRGSVILAKLSQSEQLCNQGSVNFKN